MASSVGFTVPLEKVFFGKRNIDNSGPRRSEYESEVLANSESSNKRERIFSLLKWVRAAFRRVRHSKQTNIPSTSQIEGFRPGYPRFSALLGSHAAFQLCRRFSRTRMRLLLLKQDEISMLERQLDSVDEEESKEIFLGNWRRDCNHQRKQIVRRLESCLAQYDALVDRNQRILSLSAASTRDVESLQNWVKGTSCLAREETAFLDNDKDLIKLVEPADEAVSFLEPFIEDVILKSRQWTKQQPQSILSNDPNVFIPVGTRITSISRAVIAWLVIVLLLVPALILSFVQHLWSRAAVIIVAVALFTMLVSTLSKARTAEVFAVGATYAAVLVVYVAANPNSA